jgi:hypothetical protein
MIYTELLLVRDWAVPVGRLPGLQDVTTLLVVMPRTGAALAVEAVPGLEEVPRVGPIGFAESWSRRIPVRWAVS